MQKRRELTDDEKQEAATLKKIWEAKKEECRRNGIKFTQDIAAEEMGFNTQGAISQYLNGKVPLNTDAILKFSRFLKCSPTKIRATLNVIEGTHRDDSKARLESSNIISYHPDDELPEGCVSIGKSKVSFSGGDGRTVAYELIEDGEPVIYRMSWFQKQRINPKYVKRFDVVGSSMEPYVFPGDTVLVNLAENDISCIKDGDVYAIRYDDDLRVKRLYRKLDGTLILRSYNQEYKDEEVSPPLVSEHITIIGRVRDRSGPGRN